MSRVAVIVLLACAAAPDLLFALGVVWIAVAVIVVVWVGVAAWYARDATEDATDWSAGPDDDALPPAPPASPVTAVLAATSGQAWPDGLGVDDTVWVADDRPGVYAHRLTIDGAYTLDGHPVLRPDGGWFGRHLAADCVPARRLRWCPTCFPPVHAEPVELPRRRRIR